MAADTTRIDFDLDAAERDTAKPFTFAWKGRTISLSDPAELDYRQLLEIDNPLGFLRYTASQDDRDFLASDEGKMEGWRMGKLIEAYYKHFGLDKNRDKLGF